MKRHPFLHDLLPHKPPMRLIDTLIEVDEDKVHCQLTVRQNNLFFDHEKNSVPGWIGIEFMAQTVACWSGFQAWKENNPPCVGFLLGSRRYQSHLSDFPEGALLNIHATKLIESNGIAVFDCQIHYEEADIASAQLNAYIPSKEKLQEMLNRTSL